MTLTPDAERLAVVLSQLVHVGLLRPALIVSGSSMVMLNENNTIKVECIILKGNKRSDKNS